MKTMKFGSTEISFHSFLVLNDYKMKIFIAVNENPNVLDRCIDLKRPEDQGLRTCCSNSRHYHL